MSSDDDDNQSVVSDDMEEVLGCISPTETEFIDDQAESSLNSAIDLLYEKRTTTRIKGYKLLAKVLAITYEYDVVEKQSQTILEAIKKSLRNTDEEASLAALTLACLSITLGGDRNDVYLETCQPLITHLKGHKSMKVRASCTEALATVCFVSSSDTAHARKTIAFLQKTFASTKTRHAAFLVALIDAWCLLLTVVSYKYLHAKGLEAIQPLVELLEHPSLHVKVASGEAIAFIFEEIRNHEGEDFDMDNYYDYVDVEQLMEVLEGLARSSSKRVAKKARSKQRQSFRRILSSLEAGRSSYGQGGAYNNGTESTDMFEGEGGEVFDVRPSSGTPEETLVVGSHKVIFSSWSELKQLNFLRKRLSVGFLNHLQNNELLHQIFELDLREPQHTQKMSAQEKRHYMSPNSASVKNRTQSRGQARKKRSQYVLNYGT